jgi:hypothetical protein
VYVSKRFLSRKQLLLGVDHEEFGVLSHVCPRVRKEAVSCPYETTYDAKPHGGTAPHCEFFSGWYCVALGYGI